MGNSLYQKDNSKKEDRVEKIFQRFLELWLKGDQPNPKEFVNKYPEIRQKLEHKINAFLFIKEGLEQETWQGKKLGEYVIVKELGRGGMGIVFLANQVSLGRFVALKVLPMDAIFDAKAVKRFYQEAKIVAKFSHPNIVPIYTVGEEQGAHYIAMGYVPGISLSHLIDLLRSHPLSSLKAITAKELIQKHTPFVLEQKFVNEKETHMQKPLTVHRDASFWQKSYIEFASTIGLEIVEALNYAHENGIYHRDLKPSNILLTQDGIPMIVDFGLAREFGKETTSLSKEFVGTFVYASPEQIQSNKVGFQSDIWSFGVTLFELLTLKQPFEGKTITETSQRILEANPPPPRKLNRNIPRDLETIALKCLEKEPERRYSTAKALAEDLQNFLEFKPIKAKPISIVTRVRKKIHRNPIAAIFSIGLIALFLMTSLLWVQNIERKGNRQQAEKEVGVTAPEAKILTIFPVSNSLVVGESEQYIAKGLLSNGQVVKGQSPTFYSDNPSIASVDSKGTVKAFSAGNTRIFAKINNLKVKAYLDVYFSEEERQLDEELSGPAEVTAYSNGVVQVHGWVVDDGFVEDPKGLVRRIRWMISLENIGQKAIKIGPANFSLIDNFDDTHPVQNLAQGTESFSNVLVQPGKSAGGTLYFSLPFGEEYEVKPKELIYNGPGATIVMKAEEPKKKPKADEKRDAKKLVTEQQFKQYVVRIYGDPSEGVLGKGSFEILKNAQRVYGKVGGKFDIGNIHKEEKEESLIQMGKDITGDKIPDLVISEYTGGAHCCTIFYIFSIGEEFKLIAEIDAEDGDIDFKNLDGDDNLELVTNDWAFAYWRTSFAESPAPKVILRYKNGAYHLASDLMKTPPPKPEEIRRKAQEVRNDERWHGELVLSEEERMPSSLWEYMLDLIYSGHKELAWQFVDMAWPENRSGKKEFLKDFKSQLSTSRYWPEVKALSE